MGAQHRPNFFKLQDIFQPRANSKLRPVTNSNTSRSPSAGGSEASGHPQKLVALRRCQGRRAPRPSAQATGGTAPSPEPRGPRSARSQASAGRPFPEAAARPRHPRPARPPRPLPARRPPPGRRWPHLTGARAGRAPGLRPPPGPTAARLRLGPDGRRRRRASGGGLFSEGGVSPGPGRGGRGAGRGRGKGLGKEGGRGEKKGAQTRRGRKGGRGRSRRGRKARSPPPAAACALRHHVRRGRQRVLRCSRPCFLCAPLRAGARSRRGCQLRGARRALRA